MLTNEQIENQEYSTNDVADLKMRFDILCDSLEMVQEALKNDQPHKAYDFAVNDLVRATGEHDKSCTQEVVPDTDGDFICDCNLFLNYL